MDERRFPNGKDDDVPIIGDYSPEAKARPRAQPPPTPAPRPAPRAANRRAAPEQLRVDPGDVRRHAERRRQREHVGPLGRTLRYAFGALVLAAGFAVYWNFDTLRGVTADFSALTILFADDSGNPAGGTRLFGGEPELEVVEAAGVVGANAPTSVGELPPPADAGDVPANASPPAELAPTAPAELPAAEVAAPPPAAPEPPPAPERFAFGLDVINVSEADASAAVIILRSGGRRAPSSVTWWTTDGTATAGVDYANLGKVDASFVAGEQNHTIHVPIIGDRNVEGPETFYVSLAADGGAAEPVAKVEVVIKDDD